MEEGRTSAYGFRNIRPRSREERYSLNDKVALEQNRIRQRVGFEARMHRANAPDTTDGLTSCAVGGAGYISNSDRFHSDTAGEEREQRMSRYQRQKEIQDMKRDQNKAREDERWRKIQEAKDAEDERLHKIREEGSKAKKNFSGAAYDITTLEYHATPQGVGQQYQDEMIRYRAQMRTRMLTMNGDSRASYDIINGGHRVLPPEPAKVDPPMSLIVSSDRVLPRGSRK